MTLPVTDDAASDSVLRKRRLRRCRKCRIVLPRSAFAGLARTCEMCRHELDARALEALKPAPQPRTYHGVPLLPTAPLLTAIDEAAAVIRAEDGGLSDRERAQLGLLSPAGTLCARADVTSRTYLAWRTGERPGVQASVAERVFFALDVLWWEVYDAERWPAEHEAARKVFG